MSEGKPLTNIFYVALTGNPNCGKTTVFNALTGLHAKVGNYPGVTVERKEGKLKGTPPDKQIVILDLPGTYSFSPKSLDEQVARDVLFNRIKDIQRLSAVVVIIDAANLQRNLYYATQVIELGYPVIIGLNMMDVAAKNGEIVNIEKISRRLNVPVIPMVASKKEGITALRQAIIEQVSRPAKPIGEISLFLNLPDYYKPEIENIAKLLRECGNAQVNPYAEAALIISDEKALGERGQNYPESVYDAVQEARKRIESAGGDWKTDIIGARYEFISDINAECVTQILNIQETFSDKLDRVLTH
ncbi:MAG TPA: FeoB small GTPase domain-containing protein, partial [Verrucomicrobiota bacterium]|nr:FeoB small GTPase domain-containing protein [Verrucomicrobiota bacterium]